MPNYLTPQQVAEKLGVSRARVSVWIQQKRIKALTLDNGHHLIENRDARHPKPLR